MSNINPKLLLLLATVAILGIFMTVNNADKKYTRQTFWQTATVEDAQKVPEKLLQPGNKNGPVLLWAASGTNDPAIIEALVKRGADVNESDTGEFSGTPLSAAAGFSSNPAVIDKLIELGAEVDKVVGSNDKTPLIIAAEINPEPAIALSLLKHGADPEYRDLTDGNALEQAKLFDNTAVIEVLKQHASSN